MIAGQGADTAFGNGKDDDLIGGHNVAGGHDAGDDLDGGSGVDVVMGDNARVLRTGSSLSDQVRTLSGPTMYDSRQPAGGDPRQPTGAAAVYPPANHSARG